MATMTVSEACYVVFDIVAAELQGGCHLHHPVSALKGYDIVEICTAFKLLVANDFVLYANRYVFEEKVGEEKFTKGVELYETGPFNVVGPNFVADDQVDVVGAKPAFEFDDPRFLCQETASSFAKYCRSVGSEDPIYWQKIYERLGLEYTATSPRGNEPVEPTSAPYLSGLEPSPSPRPPTISPKAGGRLPVLRQVGGALLAAGRALLLVAVVTGCVLFVVPEVTWPFGTRFWLVLVAVLTVIAAISEGKRVLSSSHVRSRPLCRTLKEQNTANVQARPRPHDKPSEQPGTTFGPVLIVIVALLVLFGTNHSTRPWLLILGIYVALTVVHLGAFVLAGLLARTPIETIELFFGRKIAVVRVKHVSLSIGWLPIGGLVRFRQEDFNRLPLAWRLAVIASAPLALFLLACLCIGSEEATSSLLRGFCQVVEGAVAPLSLGQAFVRKAIELPQREGFVVAFGVLATKIAAFNLLPFPLLNGGELLIQVLPNRYRESRSFLAITLLCSLCVMGIAAGWCIAICKVAIVSFQGC